MGKIVVTVHNTIAQPGWLFVFNCVPYFVTHATPKDLSCSELCIQQTSKELKGPVNEKIVVISVVLCIQLVEVNTIKQK